MSRMRGLANGFKLGGIPISVAWRLTTRQWATLGSGVSAASPPVQRVPHLQSPAMSLGALRRLVPTTADILTRRAGPAVVAPSMPSALRAQRRPGDERHVGASNARAERVRRRRALALPDRRAARAALPGSPGGCRFSGLGVYRARRAR